MNARTWKLWVGLLLLIVLSPLGLIVPARLGAASAWGEWSGQEVRKLLGYLPAGMSRLAETWKAPMPDYSLPGQQRARLPALGASYVLSALIGAAVVIALTILLGRVLVRRDKSDSA